MNKDKNFFYVLVIVLLTTIMVTLNIISARTIELNGLLAPASIFIYPVTFLIVILFRERYGKEKAIKLILFTVLAMIISSFIINVSALLPAGLDDKLAFVFNSNIKILVASIIAFFISQNVNIIIYDYLDYKKQVSFLLSTTIAVTIDALVFCTIAYIGTNNVSKIFSIFTGQYVYNVISVIAYTLFFYVLIATINNFKKYEDKVEVKEKKEVTKTKAVKKRKTKVSE